VTYALDASRRTPGGLFKLETTQKREKEMTTATQTTSTITGRDLAAARARARLTQRELAALLKHSERAIQSWELGNGVAPAKVPLVLAVLGGYFEGGREDNPLATYSDMALLAELAKRLDAAGSGRVTSTESATPA
jgi:DNA-binding transcriptional regulator YiaG